MKSMRFQDFKIEPEQEFSFNHCTIKDGKRVWTKITVTRLSRGYEVFAKPRGYEFPIYKDRVSKTTTVESVTSAIDGVIR